MADFNLGGLLGGLVSGYGLYDQYKQLADAGQDYQKAVQPIMQQAQENLQFRPYTVTSALGGTQISPEGQISLTPSEQQQAISSQAFGGAQQMFGQALAPQDQRVQDVYSQIRALATPQEQRDRLATEERLAAQGRLGLQSAQYGGSTPEMLAQEQAIAQARNQAALQAMSQAQAEQLQSANLGVSMLGAGYSPYAQLQNQMEQAAKFTELQQRPQMAAAEALTNLGLGGVQTAQAAEANRMNLLQQMYGVGAGLLGGAMNTTTGNLQQGALGGLVNSAGDAIGGWLSDLFNKGGSTTISIDDTIASAYDYPPASSFMPSTFGNKSTIGEFSYNPNGAGLFNF